MLPQSTKVQCLTKEVTDAKPDETSDQPDEEYGFMEAMTLDSEDEDEVENVPETEPETVPETIPETVPETVLETVPDTVLETVPETVPETIPNRQKTPEDDVQDENEVENVLKTVPEIVPNRQKTPEDDVKDENDVLNMGSITMDFEDKDEGKIEVKEDKTEKVLGFPTGQNFLVLWDGEAFFLILTFDTHTFQVKHFCFNLLLTGIVQPHSVLT